MNHRIAIAFAAVVAAFAVGLAVRMNDGAHAQQATGIARVCSQALPVSQEAAGTTPLIGPGSVSSPSGQAQQVRNSGNGIQICGYTIEGGASSTAGLEYGTKASADCDTGTVALTPAWSFGTGGGFVTDNGDYFRGLAVPPGNTLCLVSTAAAAKVIVYYNNLVP